MHLFRSGSGAEAKVTAHLGGSGGNSWNITAMNQRVASIPEGPGAGGGGSGKRNATKSKHSKYTPAKVFCRRYTPWSSVDV